MQTSHLGSIALYPSHLQLAMQHGRFEVQQCDLQTSVARFTAAGLLDLASSSALHYDLTADLAGLRALVGPEALEGTLRLQGQASGALTAISLQGTLAGQHLRYGDEHVETLAGDLRGHPAWGATASDGPSGDAKNARWARSRSSTWPWTPRTTSTVRQLQVTAAVAQSAGYSGKVRGSVHWTATRSAAHPG